MGEESAFKRPLRMDCYKYHSEMTSISLSLPWGKDVGFMTSHPIFCGYLNLYFCALP